MTVKENNNTPANDHATRRLLSLFSGCGGMDIGFEGGFPVPERCVNERITPHFIERNDGDMVWLRPTLFKTVFANDIVPGAKAAWDNYFGKSRSGVFKVESIVDLVKRHREGGGVFPGGIDIVTGGFPCQDFSLAGARRGFQSHKDHHGRLIDIQNPSVESRGQLYMWMKAVVELLQPSVFVAENVKGLVNLENVKDIIQQDFSSAGGNGYFVLPPRVLKASDFGVPQARERVFFIGLRKDRLKQGCLDDLQSGTISPYPSPTHSAHPDEDGLESYVRLKEIFRDLQEPGLSGDPSQQYFSRAKYMGAHCQGQTEVNMQGVGPTIRAEHHGNIEFRRLSSEHGGKQMDELGKGLKERRLTPRECALIQTFPPDYEFVIPLAGKRRFLVSPSTAYKLIGNAVPPLLAYHVARQLESIWDRLFIPDPEKC